jgi:nickel-dependent lactate racemase
MNDAVRTSAARGLGNQAAQELRRNYQYECGAEEKFARQQMAGGQASQRRADYEQRKAQVSSEMQSQAATDQCRESMRIIKTKRNRPNLTEGEKADLQRFEDNIRARCT